MCVRPTAGSRINGDGHSSYTYCRHPRTGKPFLPEITEVIDVATRRYLAFSIAESEATEAVHDALRAAIALCGVPLFVQWDRGSGAKNHAMHDAATGLAARLGFEVYHPRARNPQAGGVVERLHQTVAILAAKDFPAAFIGRRAKNDDLLRQVAKNIREGRVQLPTVPDLIGAIEARRAEYNATPRRSLPKIKDPVTGQMRHQSPDEAWQAAIDRGWRPVELSDHALLDEFRPEKVCPVRRGLVTVHGMSYFALELADFHEQKVKVRYDWRDGARVWVRAMDGRFICQALRDGNVRPYIADSALDVVAEKRRQAKERRHKSGLAALDAERRPVLELVPEPLTPEEIDAAGRQLEIMEAHTEPEPEPVPAAPDRNPAVRPRFAGPMAEYEWGMGVKHQKPWVTAADIARYERQMASPSFRALMGVDEVEDRGSQKVAG